MYSSFRHRKLIHPPTLSHHCVDGDMNQFVLVSNNLNNTTASINKLICYVLFYLHIFTWLYVVTKVKLETFPSCGRLLFLISSPWVPTSHAPAYFHHKESLGVGCHIDIYSNCQGISLPDFSAHTHTVRVCLSDPTGQTPWYKFSIRNMLYCDYFDEFKSNQQKDENSGQLVDGWDFGLIGRSSKWIYVSTVTFQGLIRELPGLM